MNQCYFPNYTIGSDAYTNITKVCIKLGKRALIVGGETALSVSIDKLKTNMKEFDIVDIVVNSKISEALDKNIKFDYEIEFLGTLSIEDIDMCALLANLLDNSIEACEKIKDVNPWIKLRMGKKNSFLIIQLHNSICPDMFKKKKFFKTDKENPQLHGWGIRSIDNVIEKYDGIKKYCIDEDRIELFITVSV